MLAECDGTTLNDFFEEVIPLVIDDDECGKIFNFNFPYCFHPEFGLLENLDRFDAVLGEAGSWTSNRTQIEPTMTAARIGDGL